MALFDAQFWTYFHELFESIPRQGPGLDTSTREALSHLPPLRAEQRILDIGCGAGVQTLELARRCPAAILATDLHEPFLEMLKRKAQAEGYLGTRITTQMADMGELPFPDHSFDVVWAEGSSFIIGFATALERWQRLLAPDGYLVISEFTWFADDPPEELRAFCVPDPAEDASVAGRLKSIADAGYELVHSFPLPRKGWDATYYAPLAEQLTQFEARHAGNPAALEVAAHSRHELDLYKRYRDYFGYMFFIMRR